MVASLQHSMVRGAVAMALGLTLILGSLILGYWAGPSASAEGPASVSPGSVFSGGVFYGYVFADAPGTLPDRVQALGPAGAVCGSADVTPVSDIAGFYALSVVSSDLKRGCPPRNGVVQFSLLAGRLDDGVWAEQVGTLEQRETPQLLSLRAAAHLVPNWAGSPGNIDGGSLLRWAGERALLPEALAALPFSAGAAYRLDRARGIFVEATPDAVLATGDLLLVRFQ